MLDLGWSEMAVIALVALIVLGPKELPNALRTVALWVRKARKLAREFQSGVDELVREAELEEAKKTVQSVGRTNVNRELEKTIDPTGEVSRAMRTDLPEDKAEDKAEHKIEGKADEKAENKPVAATDGDGDRNAATSGPDGAGATPETPPSTPARAAPAAAPAAERAEAHSKSA